MDRTALRQLVRDISRTETQDVADATLDSYLDEGYMEVVSSRPWSWTYVDTPQVVNLVPDINEYALASNTRRLVTVIEKDQRYPLTMVSINDWARRQDSITSTSRPVWYVYQNKQLKLWPVPATTDILEVYYYEFPVWGTGPGDEPVFDEAFHTVLVDWALSRLWEQEEDFDKADLYRGRFELKLNRMGKFYDSEVQDRPLIYGGGRSGAASPSSMPWLSDARLGGAG